MVLSRDTPNPESYNALWNMRTGNSTYIRNEIERPECMEDGMKNKSGLKNTNQLN